jgi:hypothetical protein
MPQTNKDIYAKTVLGGEGIERSQMSYGAPMIDMNKGPAGGGGGMGGPGRR